VENPTIPDKPRLTPGQERALVCLLSTPNREAAARMAGVNSRTLYRYLALPHFQAEYLGRRKEIMQAAVARAQGYAGDCIEVLMTVAKNEELSGSARVAAANSIYTIADAGLKTEDLEARLTKLEEEYAKLGTTHPQNGARNAFRTH
jgi:hypothetical protein